MRYHGQYVAYQPLPEPPMWHPPAAEQIVTFTPYARKKDMTMGSFALAPIMFGADAPVAASVPAAVAPVVQPDAGKRAVAAVKKFFKKDEATGKSKAQQVAERAVATVASRQPQPPPEPIVVQAPPPTGMAKSEMAQAGLVIAVSLGIGLGVGYIMGKRT